MKTALGEIAAVLDGLGLRWVLIGTHAAIRYRTSARTTQDIDVLRLDPLDMAKLVNALHRSGWREQSARTPDMRRLRHDSFGALDILAARTEHQRIAIGRARFDSIADGLTIPVLTIEDVIIHKLIAGRFRDLADVEAILTTRPASNARYLSEWIEYRELQERWHAVQRSDNN